MRRRNRTWGNSPSWSNRDTSQHADRSGICQCPIAHSYARPAMPPGTRDRALSVVLVAGVALVLWRGGFDEPAHLTFAVLGAAAWLVAGRPFARDWVAGGLIVAAAAVLVSLLAHLGDASGEAAAAVAALPLWYLAATAAGEPVRRFAALGIVVVSCTAAVAGLGALAVRSTPYAERIDGDLAGWRHARVPAGAGRRVPRRARPGAGADRGRRADGRPGSGTRADPGGRRRRQLRPRWRRLATVAVLALFWWRVPGRAAARSRCCPPPRRPSPWSRCWSRVRRCTSSGRTPAMTRWPAAPSVWRDAWDAIGEPARRPASGPAATRSIIPPQSTAVRLAHDEPLQLGVEAGIVAGAGILAGAGGDPGACRSRPRGPRRGAAGLGVRRRPAGAVRAVRLHMVVPAARPGRADRGGRAAAALRPEVAVDDGEHDDLDVAAAEHGAGSRRRAPAWRCPRSCTSRSAPGCGTPAASPGSRPPASSCPGASSAAPAWW